MSEWKKSHEVQLKQDEPDLYEEIDMDAFFAEGEEGLLEEEEEQQPKRGRTVKIVLGILAVVMVLSVVGPLLQLFNPGVIQFLTKSYELSKDESIQAYKQAVVAVHVENRRGTGFNISEDGFIVTNQHIVQGQQEAIIGFPDGRVFQGQVIHTDPELDIALLTLETDRPLPYLEIDGEDTWQIGDLIYFIGNPLSFVQIASEGEMVGENLVFSDTAPSLIFKAPVFSGNSGSPIMNKQGKVIGVLYAKAKLSIDGEMTDVGLATSVVHFLELIYDK